MPFVRLNGVKIHYEIYSPDKPGTPIVLLHGLGSCGDDWLLQVPAFSTCHRVLTLDLRGHGQSEKPRRPYAIGDLASDVAGLLDHIEAETAHVVGFSHGGTVALQLALDHPDRVGSLVLVNTFARYRPANLRSVIRLLRRLAFLLAGRMELVGTEVAAGLFPGPDQAAQRKATIQRISRDDRRAYLLAIRALSRHDLRPRLGQITAPTLVILGDRDMTVSPRAGEELARRIPGARLTVIPDSGHATPIDQPEQFNQAVLAFVDSLRDDAS